MRNAVLDRIFVTLIAMSITIENLTEANLDMVPTWDEYPFSCKYCLFWQCPDEYKALKESQKEVLMQKKSLWLQDTKRLFGDCGKLLVIQDIPIAYSQFAPPEFLPGSAFYQSATPDYDAVLISCLFVAQKKYRGKGYGTKLLENILIHLKGRGIGAVETFARRSNPENPSGPLSFYMKNGFKIAKDDVEYPLLRMDLSEF